MEVVCEGRGGGDTELGLWEGCGEGVFWLVLGAEGDVGMLTFQFQGREGVERR